MPYIKQENREKFELGLHEIKEAYIRDAGELNYLFTRIIYAYLDQNSICYQNYNDVIGALECCKQEFYRRSINPYESIKIKENGDV